MVCALCTAWTPKATPDPGWHHSPTGHHLCPTHNPRSPR